MTSTQRWTLAVVCAATAMLMLDIAVVNTALSAMADSAVLTTAMSSISIAVAAQTTASVQRWVLVMRRSGYGR